MIKRTRLKLTMLNSVVVCLILVCIAAFVYFSVRIDSENITDNELMNASYMMKRFIPLFEKKSPSANAELSEEYLVFTERMETSGIAYGVWDVSGKQLEYRSIYPLPENMLSGIRSCLFGRDKKESVLMNESDGLYYIHVYDFGGIRIRVCSTVVCSDAGLLRIVQTVQNVSAQDTMADRLLRWLMLAMLIGVTLSFVSGYFIAGRAIIPIQNSLTRQKEFLADASHELKTPVTIMRANLDVVKACQEDTVSEQIEWIDNAYRETEHMEHLISNMLQIAKTEDSDSPEKKEAVSLNDVCAETLERFLPIAGSKGITITFDRGEDVSVLADHQKLLQVMSIVTDNAVKYSSEGGRITLSVRRTMLHGVIEVSDTGIGMERSELEKIFERFYRTDKARSRKVGGSGLGLAIARQIVQMYSGTISADSEKGVGTTITISIPAAV
ncbi:MAG: HAMP domain-containing histidine kinase [Eubacteriales bacterium]|nr:HAMP domain-containing histidine kinase [Eubacteriales bacterium]